MLAKTLGVACYGIDAYVVDIEVDIARGLPAVAIVGLPDAGVKESRDRVKAALSNSGYKYPKGRQTVNLAPADTKKEGPSFDLPIALGMLAASEQLVSPVLDKYAIVGELALDGTVRPVKGSLPMAMACRDAGLKGMLVSERNAREAAVVEGIEVRSVKTLVEAVGFLSGRMPIEPIAVDIHEVFNESRHFDEDFSEVRGQEHVKRAIIVAAAGAHNVIMIGPPGSGKTMLASRLSTILPELTLEESLQTTKIYSVVGQLDHGASLIATRPFRSPHHTISDVALVGGGTFPMPGEVSLSHHGVLFLDELPEFNRRTLEVLRQPLEMGNVTIARTKSTVTYPAEIMLVAALNPCPCGFFMDTQRECKCTPRQIHNYMSKISGPLLDRIDIQVEVPAIKYKELAGPPEGASSADIRKEVAAAREIQNERFKEEKILTNARMSNKQIRKYCALDKESQSLLKQAMTELNLSARAYTRILKVSRTIADLENSTDIQVHHISEAIMYRSLDRQLWLQ